MRQNRRGFLKGMVGTTIAGAISSWESPLSMADSIQSRYLDTDPSGGYNLVPPQQFLFTDCRNISPGELVWRSLDGKVIALDNPEGPPVQVLADLEMTPRGVRLEAQPANREVLPSIPPSNIIHDGSMYRSWDSLFVASSGNTPGSLKIQYSESRDGYTWEKREVDTIRIPGLAGGAGHGFFIDRSGPQKERYKAVISAQVNYSRSEMEKLWKKFQNIHPYYRDPRLQSDLIFCMFGLISADGIHWEVIPEPLMISKGDTPITITYDDYLGKYLMYSRQYPLRRRMVGRAESDDFRHWTPLVAVIGAGLEEPLCMDVYTNAYTTYPGLPQQHLMFPMFYNRYDETSEIRMFSSIDGIRWEQVPGSPILTPSTPPGEWPAEFMNVRNDLVPLGQDRIALAYKENSRPHKYPRWEGITKRRGGYAWWPKGRLAAVVADEEGEFYTFQVKKTGQHLYLNAHVRGAGEIRVGLFSPTPGDPDRPLTLKGFEVADCDPISGDSLSQIVKWKGDPDSAVGMGESIGLNFKLRAAKLFGFEWI